MDSSFLDVSIDKVREKLNEDRAVLEARLRCLDESPLDHHIPEKRDILLKLHEIEDKKLELSTQRREGLPQPPMFRPMSRPAQPSNGYSHPPPQSSRKRRPGDADLQDPDETSKRQMTSFGSLPPSSPSLAGSSRRESNASDPGDDELLNFLGLDSKDSFREFQDEQRKAEKWLEERKEEERRDAECARRLQDNLLASPRPNSPQSSSSRYSGSDIFNTVGPPAFGPERSGRNRSPDLPPIRPLSDTLSRPPSLSSLSRPPAARPDHAAQRAGSQRLPPVHPLIGLDNNDIAEITPADFLRRQHPPYSSAAFNRSMSPAPNDLPTSNTYSSFRDPSGPQGAKYFPSSYSPWGPAGSASGPSGLRGPGTQYGPSVLQNTMARINASKDCLSKDSLSRHGVFPPRDDPIASTLPSLLDAGFDQPLDYLSDPLGGDPKKTSEEIKQLLETIRPDSDITKESREGTPDALKYPLLEHQKLGLSWMRTMEESEKKGGILADDMGLGKTIQALALMVTRRSTDLERKPTLIIAPVSLMQQWRREIQRMLRPGRHQLSVYVLHGEKCKRGTNFMDLKDYDVVLTTYGTLASEFRRKETYEWEEKEGRSGFSFTTRKNNLPVLGPISKWHRVILDEAQCIKNRNTRSAQAACDINTTYRWCMSGTPMMNNVEELHSLLKFLRIRPYCALEKFNHDFTRALKNPGTQTHDRAMEKLQVLLKAVLLRRTKSSKIDDRPILQLPPRVAEEVHAVFNEDEQEFYNSLETRSQIQFNRYVNQGSVGRNYSSILVLLLRLRQACCHPHLIKDFSHEANANTNNLDLVANAKAFGVQVVARLKDSENLECPICIDAVDNPILFFPCGHGTCSECFSRISDPSSAVMEGYDGASVIKCPNCRGQIDPKKITDHTTFKKVHFPGASGTETEDPKTADGAGNESDDDNDDKTLSKFIDDDEGKEQSSNKGKDKWGMFSKPKLTLADLKKQGSRNANAKRKYLRRLEENYKPSAKIEKTMEILQRIQDEGNGEKTIIFSQFTSLLDLLEIPINRKDWNYRRYDGGMKPADRNAAVMDFTDNPNCRIMLVSLKAGNSGLNLVAASRVIVFDPFWNPYAEDQAVDRAHRIGQLREVRVYRILVQATVEDRILELQAKKRDLVEGALDEKAGQNLSRLGTRELGYLFGVNNN